MASSAAPRVFVIGEALVDVVDRAAIPGGSPLNVAVGVARLGLPTVLATRFGDDEHGRLIAAHLETSEVAVAAGSVDARPTGVAEATIAADGSASYRFDIDWDPAEFTPVDPPALVHTGSIGATLAPGAAVVERLLRAERSTATISYDPNARPQLMGDSADARNTVERLIGLADVVKASDEDVAWLYPGNELDAVLADWLASGPALVVLTRGGDGADALAASGGVHIAAPVTTVADTIGAGDSFMAGLLAALADRDLLGGARREALRAIDISTLTEVVEFAARCAAITVSREGANPPTRADL
jgi:fructokinase